MLKLSVTWFSQELNLKMSVPKIAEIGENFCILELSFENNFCYLSQCPSKVIEMSTETFDF